MCGKCWQFEFVLCEGCRSASRPAETTYIWHHKCSGRYWTHWEEVQKQYSVEVRYTMLNFDIHAFRHNSAVLDKSTAADITTAFVSSWLDYANSFFYGLLSTCLTRMQCIQNSVARILLQQSSLSSRDTLPQLKLYPPFDRKPMGFRQMADTV